MDSQPVRLYSSRLAVYPSLQVQNAETIILYLVIFVFWVVKWRNPYFVLGNFGYLGFEHLWAASL